MTWNLCYNYAAVAAAADADKLMKACAVVMS